MAQPGSTEEAERPELTTSSSFSGRPQPRRNDAPLVIVSERGRHSDESRRIVRAQAARASAAQSRVTRARNRKEGGSREGLQTPQAMEDVQPAPATPVESSRTSYMSAVTRPFRNPFRSSTTQKSSNDQPEPAMPTPESDTNRTSYVQTISRPFGNPFSGGAPQQPTTHLSPTPMPDIQPTAVQQLEVQQLSFHQPDTQQATVQQRDMQQLIPQQPDMQQPTAQQAPEQQPTPQQPDFQQPTAQQAREPHQVPLPATPGESKGSSYMQTITRPFTNPFSGNSRQPQTQPPEPLVQPPNHLGLRQDHLGLSDTQIDTHIDTPPATSTPMPNPLNIPLGLITQKPLVVWLATVLNVSVVQLLTNPYAIPKLGYYLTTGTANVLTSGGAYAGGAIGSLAGTIQDTGAGAFGRIFSTATGASQGGGGFGTAMPGSIATPGAGSSDPGILQLPRALPRGFGTLNQRIQLSEPLLGLLTRTSCFDFGSPGVEDRIHGLLFDLIIGYLKAALSPLTPSGPPVQDHLRIACTCLAIFQGQRANGEIFASEPTYDKGLEAAWSEVKLLDQQALTDARSAEASLWAVFIISATTNGGKGGMEGFNFNRLLQGLFEDLQIRSWIQVRNVLLDFIYPVSFLDEPCKAFWERVQGVGVGGSGMGMEMVAA